jgi:short-subunit dehydrogenase
MKNAAVLVTGASSGIGAACARAFAREGARVALLARRRERLEALAGEIESSGGSALVLPADVSDADSIRAAVGHTLAQWSRVDVLINNAGYGFLGSVEVTTPEEFERIFAVNVMGAVLATQAVLPAMKEALRGHIINISSVIGRRGTPQRAAYAVTKFGIVGFSEALRMEVREHGIHVTVVYPGFTRTEFQEAEIKKEARLMPSGPIQSPEKVAHAIVRAVRRPRPEVYPHRFARFVAILSVVAPGLVDWGIARRLRRRKG